MLAPVPTGRSCASPSSAAVSLSVYNCTKRRLQQYKEACHNLHKELVILRDIRKKVQVQNKKFVEENATLKQNLTAKLDEVLQLKSSLCSLQQQNSELLTVKDKALSDCERYRAEVDVLSQPLGDIQLFERAFLGMSEFRNSLRAKVRQFSTGSQLDVLSPIENCASMNRVRENGIELGPGTPPTYGPTAPVPKASSTPMYSYHHKAATVPQMPLPDMENRPNVAPEDEVEAEVESIPVIPSRTRKARTKPPCLEKIAEDESDNELAVDVPLEVHPVPEPATARTGRKPPTARSKDIRQATARSKPSQAPSIANGAIISEVGRVAVRSRPRIGGFEATLGPSAAFIANGTYDSVGAPTKKTVFDFSLTEEDAVGHAEKVAPQPQAVQTAKTRTKTKRKQSEDDSDLSQSNSETENSEDEVPVQEVQSKKPKVTGTGTRSRAAKVATVDSIVDEELEQPEKFAPSRGIGSDIDSTSSSGASGNSFDPTASSRPQRARSAKQRCLAEPRLNTKMRRPF